MREQMLKHFFLFFMIKSPSWGLIRMTIIALPSSLTKLVYFTMVEPCLGFALELTFSFLPYSTGSKSDNDGVDPSVGFAHVVNGAKKGPVPREGSGGSGGPIPATDAENLNWLVDSDLHSSFVRVKLVLQDITKIPRNHLRWVIAVQALGIHSIKLYKWTILKWLFWV